MPDEIKHDIVIRLPKRTVFKALESLLSDDLTKDRTVTALYGPDEKGWYRVQLDHDPFKREDT